MKKLILPGIIALFLLGVVAALPTSNPDTGLWYNGSVDNNATGFQPDEWNRATGTPPTLFEVVEFPSATNKSINYTRGAGATIGTFFLNNTIIEFPLENQGNWTIRYNYLYDSDGANQIRVRVNGGVNDHVRFVVQDNNLTYFPSFADQIGGLQVCAGCMTPNVFHSLEFSNRENHTDEINVCIDGVCGNDTYPSSGLLTNVGVHSFSVDDFKTVLVNDFRVTNDTFFENIVVVPSAPDLLTPINNTVSSLNQTLTWNAFSGATSYYVQHEFNVTNATITICNNVTGLTCQANATGGEGVYAWNVISSNSAGNSTHSENFLWSYDTTNVLINLLEPANDNSTITNQNQQVRVQYTNVNLDAIVLNVTDPVGTVIYSNETSGIGANEFNINTTLILTVNGVYQLFMLGNDSTDMTTILTNSFIFDDTAPTFGTVNNNYVNEAETVTFDVNMSDNIELVSYIFSHNQSGVFVNDSSVGSSGVTDQLQNILAVSGDDDQVVCAKFYGLDTAGNVGESAFSCYTIQNPFVQPPFTPQTRSIYRLILPILAALIFLTLVNEGKKALGSK